MNFKFELRWLNVILFFTITMLVLAVFYANQNFVDLNRNFKATSTANATLAEITSLETSIYRTESLVKFFVITRDYKLLQQQDDQNEMTARLRGLLANDPDLLRLMDSVSRLVSERFVLWNRVIGLPPQSPELATALNEGAKVTFHIMSLTHRLKSVEQRVQSSYSENTQTDITRMILLICGTILFSISLFLYAFFKLTIQIKREAKVHMQLQNKNDELDRSNKELENFAYTASHDLQVPLRMIHAFSGRLAEREMAKLSSEGQETIAKLQGFARRMQRLIDDLLSFSRILHHTREKQPVDLNKTLADIRQELAPAILASGAVIESDPMPTLTGYDSQLLQLFQNLISNSIKYARQGVAPHIRISVSTVKSTEIKDLRMMAEQNFHKIVFSDNGIGFSNENAEIIFVIFQRLHGRSEYDGTGIGLAICKRVVQNHDGHIIAYGVEGQGATFVIYLPHNSHKK